MNTASPGRKQLTQVVGALQLARALGDNAARRRHLAAARGFLKQFDSRRPAGR